MSRAAAHCPGVWRPQRLAFAPGSADSEPVTRADAKAFVRVDHDDEDDVIDLCIAAARRVVEGRSNRLLVARSVVLQLSGFPPSSRLALALPGGRTTAIDSIAYTDSQGQAQVLGSGARKDDLTSEPALILPAYNSAWPQAQDWGLPVTITYTAGYAPVSEDPAAGIPPDLRQAVLMIVSQLYHHRELVGHANSSTAMPFGLSELVAAHKIQAFG